MPFARRFLARLARLVDRRGSTYGGGFGGGGAGGGMRAIRSLMISQRWRYTGASEAGGGGYRGGLLGPRERAWRGEAGRLRAAPVTGIAWRKLRTYLEISPRFCPCVGSAARLNFEAGLDFGEFETLRSLRPILRALDESTKGTQLTEGGSRTGP
jgi:hypothetical protein